MQYNDSIADLARWIYIWKRSWKSLTVTHVVTHVDIELNRPKTHLYLNFFGYEWCWIIVIDRIMSSKRGKILWCFQCCYLAEDPNEKSLIGTDISTLYDNTDVCLSGRYPLQRYIVDQIKVSLITPMCLLALHAVQSGMHHAWLVPRRIHQRTLRTWASG